MDSVSPCNAGFAITGGKARWTYLLLAPSPPPPPPGPLPAVGSPPPPPPPPISPANLQSAITNILGGLATTQPGDGRLQRILPAQHPIWSQLFASGIEGIRGFGVSPTVGASKQPAVTVINGQTLATQPIPFYSAYLNYQLDVAFTARPYAVVPDSLIQVSTNGTTVNPDGTIVPYSFTNEWIRFTDFSTQTIDDTVTAEVGSSATFQTGSGATPPNGPQGAPYAAKFKKYLQTYLVRFIWLQVPWRYITSPLSYITRFVGRVNRYEFPVGQPIWGPGQLLYLSYRPTRYTPPVPALDPWTPGVFSNEKWTDIEIIAMATSRQVSDPPRPPASKIILQPTGTPYYYDSTNLNWVINGHNTFPWYQTPNFYYATATNPQTLKNMGPPFYSFPFETLWMDPDAGTNAIT